MKNILNERPDLEDLHGLAKWICGFVNSSDIQNKKMLEVGCGYGWFLNHSQKKGANALTGIEIDEKSLETAKSSLNHPAITLNVANALNLPYEAGSFDTVCAWEVLEHLPKKTEPVFFSEIARVLKPNGRFYFSTPYSSLPSMILDPAWWLIGHRHYSEKKVREFVEKAGFEVEEVQVKGGGWLLAFTLNLYVAKWIFRRPPFFKNFFDQAQDKEFEKPHGLANIAVKLRKSC